jgi:hypothetical protein
MHHTARFFTILLKLTSNKHLWLHFRIAKINFQNHVAVSTVADFSEELAASIFRVDP